MLRNETATNNTAVKEAVNALTTRFGHNETQAYALVNGTASGEIQGLAAEVNRQADAFESVIVNLIYDNHIKTSAAILEIKSVLANITKNAYADRGHVVYLHANKLNFTFLEHGLAPNITAVLDAMPAERYQDELIFADFEKEALRLATIAAREKPRLDAIKAKELKDYTIKMVMDNLGLDENDATIIVNYIPVDQYNSVYHHLQGRTGFCVRFNNYVEKIMSKTLMTFEQAKEGLYDYSHGERTQASVNASNYLTDNEKRTVIKFEKWQFALLAEKTCSDFQKKFFFHYPQNSTMPSCKPDMKLYVPARPASFQPFHTALHYKNLNAVSTSNVGVILTTLTAISCLAFLYMFLKARPWSGIYGLFCNGNKATKSKKNTRYRYTSETEMSLRL